MKRVFITSDKYIYVFNGVYEPSDDTWLLMDLIDPETIDGKVVVDVCSGSGILGLYAWITGDPEKIVFIDICKDAIQNINYNIRHLGLVGNYLVLGCNLLDCLRDNSVGVVIANPPYLPGYREEYIDLYGGPRGYEVIVELIKGASRVLRGDGRLYIVFSTLSSEEVIMDYLSRYGFKVFRRITRHFFFEDIIAIEAVKKR